MNRLVLCLCLMAGACGVKGDLARPDPLWNREEVLRQECARQTASNQPLDPRCAQYQTGAPQAQ